MKKILIATFWFFLNLGCLEAQIANTYSQNIIINCAEFYISKPLTEYAILSPETRNAPPIEASDSMRRIGLSLFRDYKIYDFVNDPITQNEHGSYSLPAPIANWQGSSGDYTPPDPTGAAGPNHYIQAVNSSYTIYDKTGKQLSGIISLNKLFNSDYGDPIVLYDKYADKWILTEFGSSSTKYLYIGVSKTSDPAGEYYVYKFACPKFPDYPKYSIWSDGYYVGSNQHPQGLVVFDRNKMLNGDQTAKGIYTAFPSAPADVKTSYYSPLGADADGQLPPINTPCPIFFIEDDNAGGTKDQIVIFDAKVDWTAATPTLSITPNTKLPVPAFNSYNTGNDVVQPSNGHKLDAISETFMFRAQYRRWAGYNTTMLNHTVKVGSHWGIRWYELRQDATTGVWNIYQQSTFSPDTLNRWMGSISMDDNGSIALAYSVTGVLGTQNISPSLRYTGRLSTDSLGMMTFKEQTGVNGDNIISNGGNRFGDYSQLTLDPLDGNLFWFTGEYGSKVGVSFSAECTRIFSFKIPTTVGILDVASNEDIQVYYSNQSINVRAVNLPLYNDYVIDLFDLNGRKIDGKRFQSGTNIIETNFNTMSISRGAYLIRIGAINTSFQRVKMVIAD